MCDVCGGTGLVRVESRGLWMSRRCGCQAEQEVRYRLQRAGIPAEFAQATLQNFTPAAHSRAALRAARGFVEGFLPGNLGAGPGGAQDGPNGLLLTGTVGVGKTHLAAGILRALVEEKGIEGRFVDVRALLDRLRSSYDENARESQAQILKPIFSADLVVIDELGAARPSDWVFETIELLIGGLYNSVRPVIVTTNLPNAAGGGAAQNEYARAARPETLAERIGARMWSRLQQMCTVVDMSGPDWRARR